MNSCDAHTGTSTSVCTNNAHTNNVHTVPIPTGLPHPMHVQKGGVNELISVSDCGDLNELLVEYPEGSVFSKKIKNILNGHSKHLWRRVRQDGACFYRAYLFGILEHLARNPKDINKFLSLLKKSFTVVVESGFPQETIDDFFQEFVESVTSIEASPEGLETVHQMFKDNRTDFLVAYCRFLTSAHIRLNKEIFMPFIEGYPTVESFCLAEVDPMYVEAEQPQIIALSAEFDIPVEIIYLDQSILRDVPERYVFPEKRDPMVQLLYRPGHYDVVYLEPLV